MNNIAASCPQEVINSTRGNYLWPRTSAEDILTFPCAYGAIDGGGEARRNCSDRGVWIEAELNGCLTFSNSLLLNISTVCQCMGHDDLLHALTFNLCFQLSIPQALDEITAGLVKAIDRAVDNEDQSEQNLNLVLKIIQNIADYCRNDNVSTN